MTPAPFLLSLRTLTLLAAATLAQAVGPACGATLHTDDFSAEGLSNWNGGDFGGQVLSRQSSGGPAGAGDGYLQTFNESANLAVYNSSSDWFGNYASISADRLIVDLRNEPGSQPVEMRAVLFGPTSTSNRWTSSQSQTVPADGVWRTYTFSLSEADLSLVQGVTTYAEMISDVRRIMLRHDTGAPSAGGEQITATLGIDNIRLASSAVVPEPSTLGLAALAVMAASGLGRSQSVRRPRATEHVVFDAS